MPLLLELSVSCTKTPNALQRGRKGKYLKLSTFLCTFRKVMATTKTNMILMDAKDWLE
jgi:hypothetical protein